MNAKYMFKIIYSVLQDKIFHYNSSFKSKKFISKQWTSLFVLMDKKLKKSHMKLWPASVSIHSDSISMVS